MTATLHFPFSGSASFGPEEIRMMAAAFDAAWQSLMSDGITFSEDQAQVIRSTLAKCIVDMASAGEHDEGVLRDACLAHIGAVSLESVPQRAQHWAASVSGLSARAALLVPN